MNARAPIAALATSIAFLTSVAAGFGGGRTGPPPPPPPKPFQGCGVLAIGPQSCTLLQTDVGSWAIDDTGGFFFGDSVFVSGTIDPFAFDCFPVQVPALHVKSIGTCFQECGVLVDVPFCGIALLTEFKGLALLDQVGEFKVGENVFVQGGVIDTCFVVPECQVGTCVTVGSISRCFPAQTAACGELVLHTGGCIEFLADLTGQSYVLKDLGGFGPGDRVFVRGTITSAVQVCSPPSILPFLTNDIISECYESCGTIDIGPQSCLVFHADDGQGYFIDSALGLPGDHVFVTGGVIEDFECFPVATAPGIITGAIQECESPFSGFGTLVQGFECLVFESTDGQQFLIDPQGFQAGDFVHVDGTVHARCISICFLPCLEDVTIQPAFTGCGTMVFGLQCLLFEADGTGQVFQLIGPRGLQPDNRIRVTGIVDPECFGFCFAACMTVDTLDYTGVDLNCDFIINSIDLGILLSNWSIPPLAPGCGGVHPCPSDLNGDGFVNSLDLGIMLANWTL